MKTIWLVEDDKVQQIIVNKLFLQIRIADSLFIFNNGEEALTALSQLINKGEPLPDLILLDINMPVMNGWEFLDNLALLKANIIKPIPILMFTSSVNSNDMERAKNYEWVKDYLIKPNTGEDLKEAISKVVL